MIGFAIIAILSIVAIALVTVAVSESPTTNEMYNISLDEHLRSLEDEPYVPPNQLMPQEEPSE